MDADLRRRLARIRLVAMDVDGVLTDGAMYYTEFGDEIKKFNTRDGLGIRLLQEAGILVAFVTGEDTQIVARRARKLSVSEIHQSATDKRAVVEDICRRYGIPQAETCFIGDDIGDLDALKWVGVPVAVADAGDSVRSVARYVTTRRGGDGAVRELVELVLSSRTGSDDEPASLQT